MRIKNLIFLSIGILILQTACLGQSSAPEDPALGRVREYIKSVGTYVEKQGDPHQIIADISDYNEGGKPIWKQYDSIDEFEKAREDEESFTVAFVWLRDNKPLAVNFTYSSPSGDWVQYVYYVFREDGSAAKTDRELRTFMGDLIVNRIGIYDAAGKLLKETKTYRDLNTGKTVEPTDDFMDIDVETYKSVKDLPFAEMLKAVSCK